MSEELNLVAGPSTKSMNVLITINTERLKASGLVAGKTQDKPTMINDSTVLKETFFMVCSGSRGIIGGQGTNLLNFKANVGDFVSFEGITVDGNSDDAVIIYGIDAGSSGVFNKFNANLINRPRAVQPNSATENGLPATVVNRNFLTFETKVAKNGTASFNIIFALYNLSANGQSQELAGYYKYDPTITVGA